MASNETGDQAAILDPWVQIGDKPLTVTNQAVAKFREFLGRTTGNDPNYIRLLVKKEKSASYVYHLKIENGPIDESDWVSDV